MGEPGDPLGGRLGDGDGDAGGDGVGEGSSDGEGLGEGEGLGVGVGDGDRLELGVEITGDELDGAGDGLLRGLGAPVAVAELLGPPGTVVGAPVGSTAGAGLGDVAGSPLARDASLDDDAGGATLSGAGATPVDAWTTDGPGGEVGAPAPCVRP